MIDLQRITTQYIDTQDRLRLTGELSGSGTVVLWLTQRLVNRLLVHLVAALDQKVAHQPNLKLPSYHIEAVQGFAQQAARAQLLVQAPVPADKALTSWLVLSVDIANAPKEVSLTFRADADQAAKLTLQPTALRQWLGIVHDQYLRAQWTTDQWPQWMADSKLTPSTSTAMVLH